MFLLTIYLVYLVISLKKKISFRDAEEDEDEGVENYFTIKMIFRSQFLLFSIHFNLEVI